MSSISSLSRMISALKASEQGLNTTAHNLTNVNTKGYTRQQVLMKESNYSHIGRSETGTLSIGFGTDVQTIRQVRDYFLDHSYREESGRQGFYASKAEASNEIQTILGEIEGESFSKTLDNLWASLNELEKHPDGLETRGLFIQNAVIFAEKANLIMEQLNTYQEDMNKDVFTAVSRINKLGKEINRLNDVISMAEVSGGNANDYRDQRNVHLDELSKLVKVSYREDKDGNMMVNVENVPFVLKGGWREMNTMQAEPFSTLVVPGWPHLDEPVFNFDNPVGPSYDNDIGELKGMVMARGSRHADYRDLQSTTIYENKVKDSIIMTAQAQFDNLVHGIVTMINDVVAPNTGIPPQLDTATAPFGLNGQQGVEIFSRRYMERYDSTTGNYNEEDFTNHYSLYSAGNLVINSDVLKDYDILGFSAHEGDDGDGSVISTLLTKWKEPFGVLEPGATGTMNIREYYTGFIGNVGNRGFTAKNQADNQKLMALQIDNQRTMLSGVSSDEELGNMMKYQHAYNAAARVITVVDKMIEQVVSSLGLVGR